MAPVKNARVLFNSIPKGYPEVGKTTVYDDSQKIDLDNAPLKGGILLKTLILSIDPYMRGRMRPEEVESYAPAFKIGQPYNNQGIAVVVRTENKDAKVGDHVFGMLSFEEYSIKPNLDGLKIIKNEEKLPWSAYVGPAGMPGTTGFVGWKEFAHPKKGEVAFITSGAGPVGSMVIQLAKKDGLKVIASAGSAEKVEFLKKIGADVAFNYKETDTEEVLKKEGPINIYWDNVGGPTLDAAFEASAVYARFIICGMITGYNEGYAPNKKLNNIFEKSLSVNGFIVARLEAKYEDEFFRTIPKLLAKGELKYQEELTKGLDKVGEVILAVQKGKNKGKAAVVVAEE